MTVHLLLHARYLAGVFRKQPKISGKELRAALSRFFAGAVAALLVYAALAAFRHTSPEPVVTASPALSPTPPPTLAEFLSGLRCSGCGKHCPLSHPRCGRGEMQAQQATEVYYQTYGE